MALELKKITKLVGGQIHIKPTSLILETGHFNVLLGETGSGKTSLIKMMAGLDPIASGQLLMDGYDVTKHSTQKRQISLVHQFFVNYPHMTVFENIASPLRVAGMAKSEIQGRVEEAADILQLRPMLNRHPHELSGGQQQRTALARAMNLWQTLITNFAKNFASSSLSYSPAVVLLSCMLLQNQRRRFSWAVKLL